MRKLLVAGLVLVFAVGVAFGFASPASAAIVVNGDFQAGNFGFTSDYLLEVPAIPPATYAVDSNPQNAHPSWYSFADHTGGGGLMMIVNGSEAPTQKVWGQTVALQAGVTYNLSAWGTSVHPDAPANLSFAIGATAIGTLQLTSGLPDWKEFTATYIAPTTGPADLVIRDLATAYNGNDFALDDISLIASAPPPAVPEPSTLLVWSLLGLGSLVGLPALRRRGNRLGGAPAGRRPWSDDTRNTIRQVIERGRNQ